MPLASMFVAVSEERDGIAAEPPVDVARRAATFELDATIVATAADNVLGGIWIDGPFFGFGEIGMLVAREWRGRGVGSALVAGGDRVGPGARLAQAVARRLPARRRGDRPVPEARVRGEGRRREHVRRANGELWDLPDMGLLLTRE